MAKAFKVLTLTFFMLGFMLFAELLSGSCIFLRLPVTHSLAEGSGGNETDVIAGFGVLFFALSSTFAFILHKKKQANWPKYLAITSILLLLATFWSGWSEVM